MEKSVSESNHSSEKNFVEVENNNQLISVKEDEIVLKDKTTEDLDFEFD